MENYSRLDFVPGVEKWVLGCFYKHRLFSETQKLNYDTFVSDCIGVIRDELMLQKQ